MELSCLQARHNQNYTDVELYEVELEHGACLSMMRGGFGQVNPRVYMDGAVRCYVDGDSYNEFIEIFLDNPWLRLIIFDFNNISDWEILDGGQGDVRIKRFDLDNGASLQILFGGLTSPHPKEYMDSIVSSQVQGRGYNEFIEIFLDDPWLRILVFEFNRINQWRNYGR